MVIVHMPVPITVSTVGMVLVALTPTTVQKPWRKVCGGFVFGRCTERMELSGLGGFTLTISIDHATSRANSQKKICIETRSCPKYPHQKLTHACPTLAVSKMMRPIHSWMQSLRHEKNLEFFMRPHSLWTQCVCLRCFPSWMDFERSVLILRKDTH